MKKPPPDPGAPAEGTRNPRAKAARGLSTAVQYKAGGPVLVIGHTPTPATAAAIKRMEAGQYTVIEDTDAWLRGLGVIVKPRVKARPC